MTASAVTSTTPRGRRGRRGRVEGRLAQARRAMLRGQAMLCGALKSSTNVDMRPPLCRRAPFIGVDSFAPKGVLIPKPDQLRSPIRGFAYWTIIGGKR